MIRARAVEKRYGEKRVLRGLDLELERGGFLVATHAAARFADLATAQTALAR